jgi:hypothetical protein
MSLDAPVVGVRERQSIAAAVARVLQDLGTPEPPLKLEDVRQLLALDLQYYDGSDRSVIKAFTHQYRLFAKKRLPSLGAKLQQTLRQSKLLAFWVPDGKRVLIDESAPKPKHRWIEGHEIAHSLTDWHRDFLLGDIAATLDPQCHATIEAEANFGAGQLLFLHDRFGGEARDMPATFSSVQLLAGRYANSITSTLWRFVEQRNPSRASFGMISVHPNVPTIGAHDGPDPWRYFIRSAAFQTQFSHVTAHDAYRILSTHATYQRRGPILEIETRLRDVNGVGWHFSVESFCNSHAVLTLGVAVAPVASRVAG